VDGSYTIPGEPYTEEGYTATDNVDGDLTSLVTSTELDGVVYYSVTDSSGNVGTAQRTIFYDDPIPPELTLLGADTLSLYAGESYTEPGYTATDNVDGDLTDQVVVTGEVNSLLAGDYTLTYTVTDSYGNAAQATRTVQVKEVPAQQTVTEVPSDKVVYLTFDDGPGPYTEELLSILAKYNVKATFFVTAGNPKYLDLIAQEAAAGHSIGIHSYTHDYSQVYTSDTAFFADLNAMGEIISAQTGSSTHLMRFPGGSSNEVSKKYCTGIMTTLVEEVTDQGYTYFDWNVTSGDAGDTKDTQTIIQNVTSGMASHKISVVLQHDTKSYSVAAVESIIQWGLENGYTFLPLESTSFAAHHSVHN
jgi:peptidoglycan/xylan/chitin deacetylase (PgdA/CDA1 family)